MTELLIQSVKTVVEKMNIAEIEHLLNWWMEFDYVKNDYESEDDFKIRKQFVTTFLMDKKLSFYEKEY